MINKQLSDITLDDITSLIDNSVYEGKSIEYKRQLPSDAPEEKKKFLREICSFANTAGGDLIYGIDAVDGLPVKIVGIDSTDEDDLRLRIENSTRDGIQPRLPHCQLQLIPVSSGVSVLVIRVPRSWNAPHRLGSDGHFYGRNSAGTYQLDVGEVRQAFTLSDTISQRIRDFRTDRISRIISSMTPAKTKTEIAKLAVHIVPLSAFTTDELIDLEHHKTTLNRIAPLGTQGGFYTKLNLDGLVNYTDDTQGHSRAYIQFFRSGIIESVVSFTPHDGNYIFTSNYESQLLRAVPAYIGQLCSIDIEPPYYLFISLLNVAEYQMYLGSNFFEKTSEKPDRDNLILDEVVIKNRDDKIGEMLILLICT